MVTITIPVDFNAMNENSSIRLVTRGAIEALDEPGLSREGMEVLVEDSELAASPCGSYEQNRESVSCTVPDRDGLPTDEMLWRFQTSCST